MFRETKALADAFAELVPSSAADLVAAIGAAREPQQPFRQRLSGLRQARNDLLEWAGHASGAEMRKLDHHLRSSAGLTLDGLQSQRLAQLATIRNSARITTDEQFRLVYSRVEQIWDDEERREEFDALNRLMGDYDDRARRRRR